jgi:hypothetical protein
MKDLAVLIGVPTLLWVALIGPAYLVWGEAALVQSAVALGLCLVPAVATLLLVQRFGRAHEDRLMIGLGGSGIRMAVVLGIGFLLFRTAPETFPLTFLYWLTLFYMVALAIEVSLLVRPARDQAKNPEA